MRRSLLLTALLILAAAAPASAQQYPPTFEFTSIMKNYFDDRTGLLQLGDFVIGFAPEGPLDAEVGVVDTDSNVLGRFKFQPDKGGQDGVFSIVSVENPAEVTITKPGAYYIVFVVNGKQVTRFPFLVHKKETGDAFNPQTIYQYDGLWRTLAYLTMDDYRGETVPKINFWVGGIDLPEGERSDSYQVSLIRDGKVLAYSKKNKGHIPMGHFEYTSTHLFHPHDDRQSATAPFYTLKDWAKDGDYELRVTRGSDGLTLRSFVVKVRGGEIQPLPRTRLGYEPAADFMSPRVPKINTSSLQMREAIWIERPK